MLRIRCATLREGKTIVHAYKKTLGKRFKYDHAVAVQLDYYMSAQFAGIAYALVNGIYERKGLEISFLPLCAVGEEQTNVRNHQNKNPSNVTIGSVEQNIFIQTLASKPFIKMTAVSAMFAQTPLCIASLKDPNDEMLKIGTHQGSLEIMKRIFPSHEVISMPRSSKNTDLISGKVGAIQAYTTTEVPTLRRLLGKDPFVTSAEGLNGTKLGYSQVIFSPDECLVGDRRAIVQTFCEGTFDGWAQAIRDPEQTIKVIKEAKKILGVTDESNDHWHPSVQYEMEILKKCNDLVKGTFEGDRYGVINGDRWSEATNWLLKKTYPFNFGFDPHIWKPPENLLSGNSLACEILDEAKVSANLFERAFGRKPSLAVVSIEKSKDERNGWQNLQMYNDASNSWHTKIDTGRANGFDVREINLDASTTTHELLSYISSLSDVDGIQLMLPLPDHINSDLIYSSLDKAKDVNGIHYMGQINIGNKDAHPPVAFLAISAMMDKYDIKVKDKNVLVVGKSPILGLPIGHEIRERGGTVTIVDTDISNETLKELVGEAELIISCAGVPGLIKAEWINGAEVINMGTDVDGDISKYASRYISSIGGIAPIIIPSLFKNVAQAAWDQMSCSEILIEDVRSKQASHTLKKYNFTSYNKTLNASKRIDELSTIMEYDVNIIFTHKRYVDGVDIEMKLCTDESNQITQKDHDATQVIDMAISKTKIDIKNFSYNLHEDSIAKYPAYPRGSSKLLKYDSLRNVTYFENFSSVFPSLVKNCHLVFNDSLVLDARLFVKANDAGPKTELMILDLGSVDVQAKCYDTPLQAMVRSPSANEGDTFKECNGNAIIEIVKVKGIWEEDDKSDGNGTECFVRINSDLSVEQYLNAVGNVPIPPYFHRSSEESDKESYNNTYAVNSGSVAAPTAGLHFTNETLSEIGRDNCSFLSLHVGAGTFKPVMVDDVRDHEMHAEVFSVSVKELRSIISALKNGKELIVVGTTSSRTLESLFWLGVKRIRGLDAALYSDLSLGQFDWLPLKVGKGNNISRVAAFEALVEGLDDKDVLRGKTSLMITPPAYEFQVADHLVTNFHAPDSTLMLLVSSFIKDMSGSGIPKIYEDAQENGFKFLSYGDVCFFFTPIIRYNLANI